MNKPHQKHAKLKRPSMGMFGRNEWAILGTPCSQIQEIAGQLSKAVAKKYNIGYIDADHKSADNESNAESSILSHGRFVEYTDKIDFLRIDTLQMSDFERRIHFNSCDLILVNGNHFTAERQIIVIDSRKPLAKKLDRLTNVELILMCESEDSIPDYIRNHLPDVDNIPQLSITDIGGMAAIIENTLEACQPQVNGLILAGGQSVRMKRDKTMLDYHGRPQKDHVFELLEPLTTSTFFSIRADQSDKYEGKPTIKDSFEGLGPYGALLSAMRYDPDNAWITVTSDQPFLDTDTIVTLIKGRNSSKVATAFYNPETDFPEPLLTIWEPRAYPILLHYLSQGYSCPRKVLINTDIELLKLEDPKPLTNVNTPEEYELAKQMTSS